MKKMLNQNLFVAEQEDVGVRLDKFLDERLEEYTRSRIQKLIEDGCVAVDGQRVKPSYKIRVGDEIIMSAPELKEPEIVAEEIPLDVVYEDEDMLVINKPQGMVVHPAAGNYKGTLVNALMAYCGDTLSGINGEKRPGILHRIDKDTSGLLLVAKNDMAHQGLAAQIKAHSLTRAYKALAYGNFKQDEGTINLPIGRHPVDRKKMAVTYRNSREAITHYRVLKSFSGYSLVECRLETGRTHQIRVHLTNMGHSIVGDPVYGSRKCSFSLKGQLLHAWKVGFIHPRTGEYMEFTSELPEHFLDVLNNLEEI